MKVIIEQTDIVPSYDLESISPLGEMLLFDIETTGLKKETTQIYLIGCGYFNPEGTFEVRQWLAESAMDEREVLESFFEFAGDYSVLVHFNGDGFDIPYVAYKAEYYGYDFDFGRFESVDIYKILKPYKKFLGLERMNQTSIEQFLKIERRDKMNGGLLIPYFYEYERSKDEEAERLLLLHNNDDVRGMIQLTRALSYADIFECRFKLKRPAERFGDVLIMEFVPDNPIPVPVMYEDENVLIAAEEDLLQVNVKIVCTEAKIPVDNVEDYFYLPVEDKIIHKDVAAFVDKKYRKKATKKNCFLKKAGEYVPTFGLMDEGMAEETACGRYMIPGKKGKLQCAMEASLLLNAQEDFLRAYAQKILTNL